jgi:flagellar biosynthetic protein FliR
MHAEFTFELATLYAFLMVFARVAGFVVLVPIPGLSAGTDASRVMLSLALTVSLFPIWPVKIPEGQTLQIGRLLSLIGTEALFGLTLGLAVAFLLEGLQMAAQILGLQAGYSFASTVDPSTQADTTTLQTMAQLLAGMLFFAFGFDRQILHALARSIELTPGTSFSLDGNAIEAMIRLGASIFSTGLQLAMPVLALLVLLDIALAVLGRLHAQLQILSLSFAIKMLAALAFLAGALSLYPGVFERSGAMTFSILKRVLNQ